MHRSHSISDVLSFSMVSVLSFDPIGVRALCGEESQLGCISSGSNRRLKSPVGIVLHVLPLVGATFHMAGIGSER